MVCSDLDQFQNLHMRTFRNCYMLFSASFKLALRCCSCMHHLLQWAASYSLVMHHICLCIMPRLCLFVYYVVCFFPVVLHLVSSGNVAIVRIRSTTLVHLLHGFGLLPSGISGKMTVTLDLTTIIAMLVASMLSLCRTSYHLFIKTPKLPWHPLTFVTLPSKPLFGYVTALLSPLIALLFAGEV